MAQFCWNRCHIPSWRTLLPRQQQLFAGLSLLEQGSFLRSEAVALAYLFERSGETTAEKDVATLVHLALVEALERTHLRLHPLLREYAALHYRALPQKNRELLQATSWLAYAQKYQNDPAKVLKREDQLEAAFSRLYQEKQYTIALRLAHRLSPLLHYTSKFEQQGQPERVQRLQQFFTRAFEAAQYLGDVPQQRWALRQLANALISAHRLPEAKNTYKEALRLAHQEGSNTPSKLLELHGLAFLLVKMEQFEDARSIYKQALELALHANDTEEERALRADFGAFDQKEADHAALVPRKRILMFADVGTGAIPDLLKYAMNLQGEYEVAQPIEGFRPHTREEILEPIYRHFPDVMAFVGTDYYPIQLASIIQTIRNEEILTHIPLLVASASLQIRGPAIRDLIIHDPTRYARIVSVNLPFKPRDLLLKVYGLIGPDWLGRGKYAYEDPFLYDPIATWSELLKSS